MAARRKLVLAVIDAMKPAMLERAIELGRVPVLARLMRDGHYSGECVASFPSVTPVCAATIATGARPEQHRIPSMNWYDRREKRYVEYGTSFRASQTFGFRRSLMDTVYKMNGEHLATTTPTVFERLDDAGVRTAGTTYLIYRGRHRHEVASDTTLTRLASTVFKDPVLGPRELFYADLFSSRKTRCRAQFGMSGVRDRHAGCVGEYLVANDLFDFLLLSLPDNDTHSHKRGPDAQVTSLTGADRQIARLADAAGGVDAFLETHAVIVCSDHSQSAVRFEIDQFAGLGEFGIMPSGGERQIRGRSAITPTIAVCPSSRSAQVFLLDPGSRATLLPRVINALLGLEGVDLVMSLTDHPDGEASVRSSVGEVRFAPRGDIRDLCDQSWRIEGDLSVLDLAIENGVVSSYRYPDALARVWSALRCRTGGEVIASAAPGHEFVDWGQAHHVGGGSHGALHRDDSLAALLWCGTGPDSVGARAQWTLNDIAPMVLEHFGLTA